MRRYAAIWLLLVVTLLCDDCARAAAASEDSDLITLITPPFAGEGQLGSSVATVLNLQVWQTFRKLAPGEPRHSLGSALAQWASGPAPADHRAASRRARENQPPAQLVLWGTVERYGDGVIVQAYLTIPAYRHLKLPHPEKWRVHWQRGERTHDLELDIPDRHYAFAPIVLSDAITARYKDLEGLPIYDRPHGGKLLVKVSNNMLALRQEAGAVLVRVDDKQGWLQVPQLSVQRSEVVDFTGAVVRTLRTDWQGSYELFQQVIDNPHTPASLRTDALLFQVLVRAKQGRSAERELAAARQRNALSQTTAAYLMMSHANALVAPAQGRDAAKHVSSLRVLLAENRYLFPSGDPFLHALTELLAEYPLSVSESKGGAH